MTVLDNSLLGLFIFYMYYNAPVKETVTIPLIYDAHFTGRLVAGEELSIESGVTLRL